MPMERNLGGIGSNQRVWVLNSNSLNLWSHIAFFWWSFTKTDLTIGKNTKPLQTNGRSYYCFVAE